MKKIIFAILTFVCVFSCAICLVACNDDSSEDGDTTAVVTEVTATEWESILGRKTTLTIEMTSGVDVILIKVDGAKRSMENDAYTQIYSKEGDDYFSYLYYNSAWTRSALSAGDYTMFTEIYAQFLSIFKDDYSAFTYADGVYTCASLDKTETDFENVVGDMFENISIKFDNGAVVSVVFYVNSHNESTKIEIKNIGSTTIQLPTLDD